MTIVRQSTPPRVAPIPQMQRTVTAVPKTVSLNELFDLQTEIKHLEDAVKAKKAEFSQKCTNVYPIAESEVHKDGAGYELHWTEKRTRTVLLEKLRQDNPSTFNMAAKQTISPADLEKMLGPEAEAYMFTKISHVPKLVLTIHT